MNTNMSGSGAHDHTAFGIRHSAVPCKEWPLRKLHYNESMTMLLYTMKAAEELGQ